MSKPLPPLGAPAFLDIDPKLWEALGRFIAERPGRLEGSGREEYRYWLRASDGSALDLAGYSKSSKHEYLTPHHHDDATGEGLVLLLVAWQEPPRKGLRGCGYGASCMSKAKVTATIRLILKTAPQGALLAAPGDPEHSSKLDAWRVSAEFQTKNPRRADRGKLPIEESPLFGGERQGSLF